MHTCCEVWCYPPDNWELLTCTFTHTHLHTVTFVTFISISSTFDFFFFLSRKHFDIKKSDLSKLLWLSSIVNRFGWLGWKWLKYHQTYYQKLPLCVHILQVVFASRCAYVVCTVFLKVNITVDSCFLWPVQPACLRLHTQHMKSTWLFVNWCWYVMIICSFSLSFTEGCSELYVQRPSCFYKRITETTSSFVCVFICEIYFFFQALIFIIAL